MIKINGKRQQPNPGSTTNGSEASGVKVWVTPPGKESQPAEVLAEGKENTESVVEEDRHKYQLQPCDQLQKHGLYCHEYFLLILVWIFVCVCVCVCVCTTCDG